MRKLFTPVTPAPAGHKKRGAHSSGAQKSYHSGGGKSR